MWYNNSCINLKLKRRTRAIQRHSRYPSDKRHYNAFTLKFKRLFDSHKSDYNANYASSLSHKDGSLLKNSRKLLRIHYTLPSLHNNDGAWAVSDQDKSNIFMKHLESTFQPYYNNLSPSKIEKVENFLASPLQMCPPPRGLDPKNGFSQCK